MTRFSDVDPTEMLRVEGGERSFLDTVKDCLVQAMPLLGLLFGTRGVL